METGDGDEGFALELLREHLAKCGGGEVRCAVNTNDPPDLIVIWTNGIQWGVEVTRTYHQVTSFDGASLVSSEQIRAALWHFAKKLEEETQDIRKRSYAIGLEGPGPFSSWKNPPSGRGWKKWKAETREQIWQHIVSGKEYCLKIPGVWLTPREPGKSWRIHPSSGPAEIGPAISTMLLRAMMDKVKRLPNWNGRFSERWLLLLNCYPLAEDLDQVKSILLDLVRARSAFKQLSGVFWSGYPERRLLSIPLQNRVQ